MRTQLVDGLLADLLQDVRFLRVYNSVPYVAIQYCAYCTVPLIRSANASGHVEGIGRVSLFIAVP